MRRWIGQGEKGVGLSRRKTGRDEFERGSKCLSDMGKQTRILKKRGEENEKTEMSA